MWRQVLVEHYAETDQELADRMSLELIQDQYQDVFQQRAPDLDPKNEQELDQIRILSRRSLASNFSINGFERNLLFKNYKGERFEDKGAFSGLDSIADARSFALLDIDLDGRQDVVIKNLKKQMLEAYQNVYPKKNKRVAFRLQGTKSSRDAVGTRLYLKTSQGIQMKQVQSAFGFLAQNAPEVYFGLGSDEEAQVDIIWASGQKQSFAKVPAGHFIDIKEGEGGFQKKAFLPTATLEEDPLVLRRPADKLLREAPEFEKSSLQGQQIRSKSFFSQKPTVMIFMTSWCISCKRDLAILRELYNKDLPYQVLLVQIRTRSEPFLEIPDIPKGIPLITGDTPFFLEYFKDVNIGFPTRYWISTEGKILQQIQGGLRVDSLPDEYKLYFETEDKK